MTGIISRVIFKARMNSRWVKSESILNNDDQSVSPPKPGGPLKPRLNAVQKKIELQIARLAVLHTMLQSKDEADFLKLVSSRKENNVKYSTVLSSDLEWARRV